MLNPFGSNVGIFVAVFENMWRGKGWSSDRTIVKMAMELISSNRQPWGDKMDILYIKSWM